MKSEKINVKKSRHNHKYPDFLIRNWKTKPWSLNENRRVMYDKKRHMGEKSYYDDNLENDLSKVEGKAAKIIRSIINGKTEISNDEWYKLILFINIQAIRLENICNFINEPDSMFPGNNEFLFGVYSSDDKKTIIEHTRYLVDIFLENDDNLISRAIVGLGLVFWKSADPVFAATDNAIFKEVDLDGNFLFVMLPVSPNFAILVTKNKYFANERTMENYKWITGDSHISNSTLDNILINNFNQNQLTNLNFKEGRPDEVPTYVIKRAHTYSIVEAMIKDAKKLIFYDGPDSEILSGIKNINPGRKIINSLDFM